MDSVTFEPGWLQKQVARSVASLDRLPPKLRESLRGAMPELETVSMMDDTVELRDELHTIRQEWGALVRELRDYIEQLRNPVHGPVAMRSHIADQLEDIMRGE